jgi:preprotein translocase subunit Sec61beta
MAKKQSKEGGFQSAAGLVRYFESEEDKIKINPWFVVGLIVITIIVIEAARVMIQF